MSPSLLIIKCISIAVLIESAISQNFDSKYPSSSAVTNRKFFSLSLQFPHTTLADSENGQTRYCKKKSYLKQNCYFYIIKVGKVFSLSFLRFFLDGGGGGRVLCM
jgi:hypothetical protein